MFWRRPITFGLQKQVSKKTKDALILEHHIFWVNESIGKYGLQLQPKKFGEVSSDGNGKITSEMYRNFSSGQLKHLIKLIGRSYGTQQ